jgi:hypothetical protein
MTKSKTCRIRVHAPNPCERLEPRTHLTAPGYLVSAPADVQMVYANNFTNLFKQPGSPGTPGYTGSDGIYAIPLNGIDKLGSAYETAGWQMYTTGDTFIGSYNATTGVRTNGTKLVNNTAAIHNASGLVPTTTVNKWRGSYLSSPAEVMAIASRPTANSIFYYWPSDGVVVNGQLVQLALRQNASTLETQGVAVFTAPVDETFNANSDWPYSGVENTTWFNSDNRTGIGSARNVFLPDTSTTDAYNGPRSMGAAIFDSSSADRAFQSDGNLYVYGTQLGSGFFQKYAFVARSPAASFGDTASWQYWSQLAGEPSGSWRGSTGATDAIGFGTPMRDVNGNFITDIASEFSVVQVPDGGLMMLYNKYDFFGGGELAVRYAPAGHPEGPWTTATTVYAISTPNAGNPAIGLRAMPAAWANENWLYGTYGAKVIPQLSQAPTATTPGKLLVSYHIGALDGSPASGTQVFGPEFTYGDIYRPRFLELTIAAVDTTPPRILASTFDRERLPLRFEVAFSESVGASLTKSDFTVTDTTSVQVVNSSAYSVVYDTETDKATILFSAALPNGQYQVHFDNNAVFDTAGNALPPSDRSFKVLAGDADGDGSVNFADLVILAQNYGRADQSFSQGNFDYSATGVVDFADLVLLAQNYGTTLFVELASAARKRRLDRSPTIRI